MNNQLIPTNNQLTMTSVELTNLINQFRSLESNKKELLHKNLMAKIKKELETLQSLGLDAGLNFQLGSYKDEQNQERPCYQLNRNGILQMLNSESTLVRAKTIEYINALEKELTTVNNTPALSEKDQCVLDLYNSKGGSNAILIGKRLVELEVKEATTPLLEKIEEDAPKVSYANTVQESEGSMTIGAFAKSLKDPKYAFVSGRNKMFQWLREKGFLITNDPSDYNTPKQKYITQKWFEVKPQYNKKTKRLDNQTFITGKGQIKIKAILDSLLEETIDDDIDPFIDDPLLDNSDTAQTEM